MSVEQLENGLMQLWRDTWNAEAFAFRKNYYRQLLRGLRNGTGSPLTEPDAVAEADRYFALPTVEEMA